MAVTPFHGVGVCVCGGGGGEGGAELRIGELRYIQKKPTERDRKGENHSKLVPRNYFASTIPKVLRNIHLFWSPHNFTRGICREKTKVNHNFWQNFNQVHRHNNWILLYMEFI